MEKNCENCRFYIQYYRNENGLFKKQFGCGQCGNTDLDFKTLKMLSRKKELCNFWEPIEIKKVKRKSTIIKIITDMEKHLNDIKQILKEDETIQRKK